MRLCASRQSSLFHSVTNVFNNIGRSLAECGARYTNKYLMGLAIGTNALITNFSNISNLLDVSFQLDNCGIIRTRQRSATTTDDNHCTCGSIFFLKSSLEFGG